MSTMYPCRCWPIDIARNIPSNDRALAKTQPSKYETSHNIYVLVSLSKLYHLIFSF